jgi:hypothetical protein
MLPDLIAAYAVSSGLELQEGILVASKAQVLMAVNPRIQIPRTITAGKQRKTKSSPSSKTLAMSSECVRCAKDREEDAYASVIQSNRNALEYQRFGAECLALENKRRFELNAKRPSRCNDHRSETVCM